MPDVNVIDVRITVTRDREIFLDSDKLNIRTRRCITNLKKNSLQEQTIKALIQWLQDKRLHQDEIYLLGAQLHAALLDNDVGRILQEHRTTPNEFLRIEIAFEDPTDEIATWPYEYLYCLTPAGETKGYFIANEPRYAITRLPAAQPSRPVQVKGETVRVLVVAASPRDLPQLEFGALLKGIQELQWVDHKDHGKGKKFELVDLVTEYVSTEELVAKQAKGEASRSEATWDSFTQKLKDLKDNGRSPHVIHFVGHGQCSKGKGEIAFAQPNLETKWVNGDLLASALSEYDSVKLVFLQACESAMPTQDVYAPYQALSNVARCLASVSIPAVVAMQSKIEIVTANTFAKAFYESLVQMMPVYQAVQMGRKTIPDPGALGIPVCYLLRYSNEVGVLFPASDQPPVASSGAIGLSPGGSGRIRCVWCGEMSRRASKCSNCLGQLHCPNPQCPRFVEFQPGDSPLGETEKYVCECGSAFTKDGSLQTVRPLDDFKAPPKQPLV